MMKHEEVGANGVRLHVVRAGAGQPLVLLHGWPEFWLTWEPVMARLAVPEMLNLINPTIN